MKNNAELKTTINPGGAGPEILTVQETARLLKLPVSSIYEKSRKRSAHGSTPPLPCRRVGKYLRFFKAEVLQWLENLPKNNSRIAGKIAAVALVLLLSALGAMAQKPAPCKVISFAVTTQNGAYPLVTQWEQSWLSKNAKKFKDVCFSQSPMPNHENFTIVLSDSPTRFTGLQAVVTTSTTTTPVSGQGTVTNQYGQQWAYSYDGTVTTTTTSATNVPVEIDSNTLYATAYNERGEVVGQRGHTYSTQTGGDGSTALGYNLGNALMAINARGRMLSGVVKDVERQ